MKRFTLRVTYLGAVLAATVFSIGCSSIDNLIPDRQPDYKKSGSVPSLEVPPDLTGSTLDDTLVVPDTAPGGTASYSDYSRERRGPAAAQDAAVLPQPDSVRVERDGERRWLVVQGEPSQVWPKVREFWLQNGFLLVQDDPRLGIMETSWAENRADIPVDFIRSAVSKAFANLYSSATRDKFRMRLDYGVEPGTTEVYLTHYGMEETTEDDPIGGTTRWVPRPNDPGLEAEMLRRVTLFLGVEEERARAQFAGNDQHEPQARLEKDSDGNASLLVKEDFSRAWRRTGLALDRVGFTVEDRDRSQGVYYVRYNDPYQGAEKKGFLSKLAFWSSDEPEQNQYQVNLTSEGAATRVVVTDPEGKRAAPETAARILGLLEEELR